MLFGTGSLPCGTGCSRAVYVSRLLRPRQRPRTVGKTLAIGRELLEPAGTVLPGLVLLLGAFSFAGLSGKPKHKMEASQRCDPAKAVVNFTVSGDIPPGSIRFVGAPECLGSWCYTQAPEATRQHKNLLLLKVCVELSSKPIGYRLMQVDDLGKFGAWESDTDRKLEVTAAQAGQVVNVGLEWGQLQSRPHASRAPATPVPAQAVIAMEDGYPLHCCYHCDEYGDVPLDLDLYGDLDRNDEDMNLHADLVPWDSVHPEIIAKLDREFPTTPGQDRYLPYPLIADGIDRLAAENAAARGAHA